jgi:hypothetical protein
MKLTKAELLAVLEPLRQIAAHVSVFRDDEDEDRTPIEITDADLELHDAFDQARRDAAGVQTSILFSNNDLWQDYCEREGDREKQRRSEAAKRAAETRRRRAA